MNWYAIYTYSGFEKKVKRDIEHRASIEGMRGEIADILIPEEKIVEVKDGRRKESSRNLMPGYVFVRMNENKELFEMIEEINGVSRLVGSGEDRTKPTPLSDAEVEQIVGMMEDKKARPKPEIKFRVGDQVKVIEGPFANFIGSVEDIDSEKARLKVMVSIFGRATPVDLGVLEVEKA